MDNVTMAASELLPKINSLFNNPLYSDVQFVFLNKDGTAERMYCHKLILALQSKVFAHLFFEKESSPSIMRMQASKQQLFNNLFKFLYTGEVHFSTFNEAQNLYELANDYVVEGLIVKCYTYMLQERLTVENLFLRYDYALKQQLNMVLIDCQNFLCSNVEIALKSDGFTNASPEVVEHIIKLADLPVSSELEVITAVLNWGLENIGRNEITLRESIDPFLKHLRILTLTSAEFKYLVQHYNIFTAYESMALTQKIMMPESSNKLPGEFCCITTKRNSIISHKTSAEYQHHKAVTSNSPTSVQSDPLKYAKPDNNKISYEVRKCQMKNGSNFCSEFKQKFNSSPNINDVKFPASNFSQNNLRLFLFPLKKSEKSFPFSFPKDINCSVIIKMRSGNFSLCGLELKLKNAVDKKEQKKFTVYLEGFSKQLEENSYILKLDNDVHSIIFPETMKLQEGNKGKIEVSIESLPLNRCYQIRKKLFELNSGLNFKCEFFIDSNQKYDHENILFLINKLIYVSF